MATKKDEKQTGAPAAATAETPKKTVGTQHHIVANPDGGWDLKRSKGEKAIKHFSTKQEAIDYGRSVSQNQETEFVIHGLDGKIQVSHSHGKPASKKK